MKNTAFIAQPATLREANTQLLARYARHADYMLMATFREGIGSEMPSEEKVHEQLRHMNCSLNRAIWKNRTRFYDECQILFIPIVEGAKSLKRIHAHILLGNVGGPENVITFMHKYILLSKCLGETFSLSSIWDATGMASYLTKETDTYNADAVAWQLASIPKPLLPK